MNIHFVNVISIELVDTSPVSVHIVNVNIEYSQTNVQETYILTVVTHLRSILF